MNKKFLKAMGLAVVALCVASCSSSDDSTQQPVGEGFITVKADMG